jgi:hypothetical protein
MMAVRQPADAPSYHVLVREASHDAIGERQSRQEGILLECQRSARTPGGSAVFHVQHRLRRRSLVQTWLVWS